MGYAEKGAFGPRRAQGAERRAKGEGRRVQGAGCRVQGAGVYGGREIPLGLVLRNNLLISAGLTKDLLVILYTKLICLKTLTEDE